MSSSTFAAVSAANNAAAQAAAHSAKVERCTVEVNSFDSALSTVAQKQSYADCVSTLWPQDLTSGDVLGIKVAIVVLLLSAFLGLLFGWKEDGPLGSLLFGFVFPFVVTVAAGVLGLVGFALYFLFT